MTGQPLAALSSDPAQDCPSWFLILEIVDLGSCNYAYNWATMKLGEFVTASLGAGVAVTGSYCSPKSDLEISAKLGFGLQVESFQAVWRSAIGVGWEE